MKYQAGKVAILGCVLSLFAVVLAPTTAQAEALPIQSQLAPIGSTVALPHDAIFSGAVPSRTLLHVDVVMHPKDPSALASFVKEVSTPGSPEYRHFLAKGQFGSIFGPTNTQIAQVRNTLASEGLTLGHTSQNGLIIPVTATAQKMVQSFHTRLVRYRLHSGRMAMANTSAPMLPASISPIVQNVIGLNTVYRPKSALETVPGASPLKTKKGSLLSKLSLLHLAKSSQPLPYPANDISAGSSTAYSSDTATKSATHHLNTPYQESLLQASTPPSPCSSATSTASSYSAYTANQIASAYGLTSAYNKGDMGNGETIALYELAPFSS
ncbi:MAG: protease pro-enzyme activation domain-containing protein, partial [Actinobacteria bacterium]|nr:protease pro-enzyme activation domain-containing protein [Actinomycetota bacterium]